MINYSTKDALYIYQKEELFHAVWEKKSEKNRELIVVESEGNYEGLNILVFESFLEYIKYVGKYEWFRNDIDDIEFIIKKKDKVTT